jgi:hypothetical protein
MKLKGPEGKEEGLGTSPVEEAGTEAEERGRKDSVLWPSVVCARCGGKTRSGEVGSSILTLAR